jgi:hypothetical protein
MSEENTCKLLVKKFIENDVIAASKIPAESRERIKIHISGAV